MIEFYAVIKNEVSEDSVNPGWCLRLMLSTKSRIQTSAYMVFKKSGQKYIRQKTGKKHMKKLIGKGCLLSSKYMKF